MTVDELLRRGRLEQQCPACGCVEAAGSYCTSCLRSTGPDDWRRSPTSALQDAAFARARAARHSRPQAPVTAAQIADPTA